MGADTLYITDILDVADRLPWPVKLAFPFIFGLLIVAAINLFAISIQVATGINVVEIFTLHYSAPDCPPIDATECFGGQFSTPWAHLASVSVCAQLAGTAQEAGGLNSINFTASRCNMAAGYVKIISGNSSNSSVYAAAYRQDNAEPNAQARDACTSILTGCAVAGGQLTGSIDAVCPASFAVKAAEHEAACKGGGLYLFDPLPLTFISLMFYLGAFAISYYGNMIR